MRQIIWAVGVGFCGFIIGGIAALNTGSFVGSIWGATIGYGFGSIFSQTRPTRKIVVYWTATLALVCPLFSIIIGGVILLPKYPPLDEVVAGLTGAGMGAVLGLFIGGLHLNRIERRSQGEQGVRNM